MEKLWESLLRCMQQNGLFSPPKRQDSATAAADWYEKNPFVKILLPLVIITYH